MPSLPPPPALLSILPPHQMRQGDAIVGVSAVVVGPAPTCPCPQPTYSWEHPRPPGTRAFLHRGDGRCTCFLRKGLSSMHLLHMHTEDEATERAAFNLNADKLYVRKGADLELERGEMGLLPALS